MDEKFDIIEYLRSKGLTGKRANGPEYAFPCFFCGESSDAKKKKLYVNSEENCYYCFVCGEKGFLSQLQKHFGDEPTGNYVDTASRRQILNDATEVAHEMLLNNDEALLYLLNDRGLLPETIRERMLGFVPKGWSLVGNLKGTYSKEQLKESGLVFKDGNYEGRDFFYNHLIIPYRVRNDTVAFRGRLHSGNGARYASAQEESPRVFDYHRMDDHDEIILVEGEMDAIILQQCIDHSNDKKLQKFGVVSIAGINAKPKNFESYFKSVKRVYIGFDSDEPGKKGAKELKELFRGKARIIELPTIEDNKVDWGSFLLPIPKNADPDWRRANIAAGHTWKDVLGLVNSASGKRVFSMQDAELRWRQREALGPGLKTGFASLDAALFPGIRQGDVVVIMADTNVGKTNFLCNLAYKMRDYKTLYISLETTLEDVYERLRMIYRFYDPGATSSTINNALKNVFIVDENLLTEKDLQELIEEFEMEAEGKLQQIFVDYLGYYAKGQPGGNQTEKTGNAIMQLKAEAKKGKYVIWTPSQVSRTDEIGKPLGLKSAKDSSSVEQTANVLISLYNPKDAPTEGNVQHTGKVKCEILKTKRGGEGKLFNIQFDPLTLAMMDESDPLARQAQTNAIKKSRGMTYAYYRNEVMKGVQQSFDDMK